MLSKEKLNIIAEARKSINKLKKTCPGIFPEYNALRAAEEALVLARKRVEIARENWKRL